MVAAIHTAEDLIRILRQDPEILEQVRRAILTDELLELPRKFAEMVQTQANMAETQAGILDTQARMAKTQAGILDTQARMAEDQARMAKIQAQMLETQNQMLERQQRLEDRVGILVGAELERKAFRILPTRLNRIYDLRRPRVVLRQGDYTPDTQRFLDDVENALDSSVITEPQYNRITVTDLIVRATRKDGKGDMYFAVEASGTIARRDIDRAFVAAAAIYAVYQVKSEPVVVGYRIHSSDKLYADELPVRTIILEEDSL